MAEKDMGGGGGGGVKTNLKVKAVIKENERVPDLYNRKTITGQNTMNAHSNKNRWTMSWKSW